MVELTWTLKEGNYLESRTKRGEYQIRTVRGYLVVYFNRQFLKEVPNESTGKTVCAAHNARLKF